MVFDLKKMPITSLNSITKCGSCGRIGYPVEMGGDGNAKILVVFESPTKNQQRTGNWLCSNRDDPTLPYESSVFSTFNELGIDCRSELKITGVFGCMGEHGIYAHCVRRLSEQITAYKPQLIVSVGSVASGAVFYLYNPSHFASNCTEQHIGYFIPFNDWNCWWTGLYSDKDIKSYYNEQEQQIARDWNKRILKYALDNYIVPPSPYQHPQPELLYATGEIASFLREASSSKYTAFDYETNCLHPEQNNARVLTASAAYGDSTGIKRAAAFPMTSAVVEEEWKSFLKSPAKKIIANVKFEERWGIVYFNTPMSNFMWDVCIGGRVFDSSPGNAGLKFLTFSNFGVVGYDDDVDAFIKDDESGYNRLSSMPPEQLLLYNCYDSIYTFGVAQKQYKMLNREF